MAFYRVSDKVAPHIIQSATKGCVRDDCKISARIGGGTCMGTSDYYDKNGILHINDPNRFTAELCCSKCWKSWVVDNKGNIISE